MTESTVLDGDDVGRTLTRIAHEIAEKNPRLDRVAVVGIHTRGAFLAARLHRLLLQFEGGGGIPLGEIDISFYRDDLGTRSADRQSHQPVVHATRLDFEISGRTVVLVDDVLFTGRTVRAAIDALFDFGRPARIQLAVLCDRGHRELPIRPDYVGKNLPTALEQRVEVRLEEVDGSDGVLVIEDEEASIR